MQEVLPNLRYATLASESSLQAAARRLNENGMTAHIVESGANAHRLAPEPVSYTHLTLPTIYSV